MPDAATAPAIQPHTPPAAIELPSPPETDRKSLSKETFIAMLAATGIAVYLFLRYALQVPVQQAQWALWVVLFFGGLPLRVDLARNVVKGEFGSDFLAGMSIVVSALLGQHLAGSIVVLMLSGGTALEQYAMRRASAVLGALAKRMPSVVHRKDPDGSTEEIRLDDVQIDYRLVVFPHEICPPMASSSKVRARWTSRISPANHTRCRRLSARKFYPVPVNGEAVLVISLQSCRFIPRYAKIMPVSCRRPRPTGRTCAAWPTASAPGIRVGSLSPSRWRAGSSETIQTVAVVLVIATPCPLLWRSPLPSLVPSRWRPAAPSSSRTQPSWSRYRSAER